MNGINIFHSNKLEILAEQLARIVIEPLPDPFVPEVIVVQSRGMERWVSMELARHNKVCANCRFPFPNAFLDEVFKKVISVLPERSEFDPEIMTFKIMDLLPKCIRRPEFESLGNYLKEDHNKVKLFQLAEKIAYIFDQYLVFRPEMIFAWESGREKHWQAHLWRLLSAGNEKHHRARLREILLESIENQSVDACGLPARLSIFGISYLPPFHMQVFLKLSGMIPVNLFLMNPCREYWGDIVTDREIKKIKKRYSPDADSDNRLHLERGNRLLASLGALGRDFFSQISDLDCNWVERFEQPGFHDMLGCVQSDILNLVERKESSLEVGFRVKDDPSIQIHCCHSPMREVETLHDNLLAMFEADPELLPKDIIVMTPDIEVYAPYIQAVFNAQTDASLRIPFTIADRSVKNDSRLIDGFLALLALKDSRMGAATVMNLLEIKAVSDRFELTSTDIERVEHWVRETNIRWGVDARDREKSGVPSFRENTWQAGIERLLLGYAMPEKGEALFSGILPYDHIEGKDGLVLGRFLDFMGRIIDFINHIETDRTLDRWNFFLSKSLDDFFLADETSEAEMLVLRRVLDDLRVKKEISGFNEPVGIDCIRSLLKHYFERETFAYGFISGGVTFCAMLPMRSIPFKVVCLIGMNTETFPREDRPVGFDLIRKNPRRWDRSRRRDDKYLFLEALLSARNLFYISYVGQSIQDNSLIPPSVLVSELIDYLKKGFGLKEDQPLTRHRLQAFSAAYFLDESGLFTYSEENLKACSGLIDSRQEQKPLPAFIPSTLSMTAEEIENWKHLNIKDIASFFSNPARYLLQRRLGIYLEEDMLPLDERENFELSPLEQYAIGQNLVDKQISGVGLNKFRSIQKATGRLPHGTVGDVRYSQLRTEAETFVKQTEPFTKDQPLEPLAVDLNLAGFHVFGTLENIFKERLLHPVYAKFKTKYILITWIYHLILNVLDKINYPRSSLLICKDTAREFQAVSRSRDIFVGLLEVYRQGLIRPAHFFPDSSYEFARQFLEQNKSRKLAVKAAEKKWNGSDFQRGEYKDPYYELCFGKMEPAALFSSAFQNVAKEIFSPLMKHLRTFVL